jgi:hypothetical protein
MTEMVKKSDFLDQIKSTHRELEIILAKFPLPCLEEAGQYDDWTVRDIIAHIAWYEIEMVNMLKQRALAGSDWWDLPLEQRNTAIFAACRDATALSVIKNESSAYQSLLELLEALDETALNDPPTFAGMPAEWQPWSVIASNTYEHYLDHFSQLQACLAEQLPCEK